jgi:hypothetical protein
MVELSLRGNLVACVGRGWPMWKRTASVRLAALLALGGVGLAAEDEGPRVPVRIRVDASRGEITPQSKGGGGFQRTFRFTAVPGEHNHWIRQVLEVRGTVLDAEGDSTPVHLDVIEYYRVDSSGRTIQPDSHYSQYWEFLGGDLTIRSTLTYGTLRSIRRGDTILSRSFILRSASDAAGNRVTMRKRTNRRVIPAEGGRRVEFRKGCGSIATHYAYRVRWDARRSRTRPSGRIEVGTWWTDAPESSQGGHTAALARPRPIPLVKDSPH